MDKTYFIAEIGVNHEGDLNLAKQLITDAKHAGADAAKFQTYKAEKLASENSPGYWDFKSEATRSQFELFKKFDSFGQNEYLQLYEHCQSEGIDFISTAFDVDALSFLIDLMPLVKVASADITNFQLLREINKFGKPVVLSTGASTIADIHYALEVLSDCKVTLLHCVLNYPTPDQDAYMAMMDSLKKEFPQCEVGYSDHTLPVYPFPALLSALYKGATVIEKHFTNDKSRTGNDHYHAFDKHDLKNFRELEARIALVEGDLFQKQPTPNEGVALVNARRAIYLTKDLPVGHILTEKDLIPKRPNAGVSAKHWPLVIGKKLLVNLRADTALKWTDID